MKQLLALPLVLLLGLSVAQAQNFVALNKMQPPANFSMIYDESVISDDYSEAHVIWAAPGFKKERQGAPAYEQLFVLAISFVKSSCFSSLLCGFVHKYGWIISESRCWNSCLLGEHLIEHPLHVQLGRMLFLRYQGRPFNKSIGCLADWSAC